MRQTLVVLALMGAMLLACAGLVLAQGNGQKHGKPPPPGSNIRVCPSDGPQYAHCDAVRHDVDANAPINGEEPTGGNNTTEQSPTAQETTKSESTTVGEAGESNPAPKAATPPSGYFPADLQSAYKLPSSTAGSGQTVAIVDAFDDPNAESDLGVYRSQFGLPSCTTANGCFRKVDQRGGTSYPSPDDGWAQEISLDLDMVSAICPSCKILLVEADSNSTTDLYAAENAAASLGSNTISNSWGGSEYRNEVTDQAKYFNHPHIAITFSSGDSGYGVEFPAASEYVTAVGGTTLNRASNERGWTETIWSGTGSGCSKYVPKPTWQTDRGCNRRTVGDVAADADPDTGVAAYDSYHAPGWLVFGGTSVSSPIIASIYALAGNASSVTYGSYPYSHTSSLFDITSGRNGRCPNKLAYFCHGEEGYDGPSGNGTPNGTGAF
jgi:subtilase family serine protease